MAFVSRDPRNILNPETADGCFVADTKTIAPGTEFIGFYKNCYTDSQYNNKCYVLKGRDDGRDYLFFGATAIHSEMKNWKYGDLMCFRYEGMKENKGGKFAGKLSHIWKISGDDSREPDPAFVAQLQQEVMNRRMEVQQILASQNRGGQHMQSYPQAQGNYTQQVNQTTQYAQQQYVQPNYQYQQAPVHANGNSVQSSNSVNPYPNQPKHTDPFG